MLSSHIFNGNMWRFLSSYTQSYFPLVLCGVAYLCQFEGNLECIYMGYFGLIMHSGFGDGSGGPVLENTDLWIPYNTIVFVSELFSQKKKQNKIIVRRPAFARSPSWLLLVWGKQLKLVTTSTTLIWQ